MINVDDIKSSFVLINPEKEEVSVLQNDWNCERLCSVLYSKELQVIPIKEYSDNLFKRSYLSPMFETDKNIIRNEVLHMLEFLDIDHAVIKYPNEKNAYRISKYGEEKPLSIRVYESSEDSKIYIYEGYYFSFDELKRYFFPKNKSHLKNGMIVEYFNNNKWNVKEILDIDSEFSKMYELLIKYDKLRVPVKG